MDKREYYSYTLYCTQSQPYCSNWTADRRLAWRTITHILVTRVNYYFWEDVWVSKTSQTCWVARQEVTYAVLTTNLYFIVLVLHKVLNSTLFCLDYYLNFFMIICRTKPADKLQFETFSPEIPHFKPSKYNPCNKNVPVPGCACILAAHPF